MVFTKKLFYRKKQIRASGDRARDSRNWVDAERDYKRYLSLVPHDLDIWVQLGHALKEQGKLLDAEQAYQHVVKRRSDDLDAINHLAHVLKDTGQTIEATKRFNSLFLQDGRRDLYALAIQFSPMDAEIQAAARAARTVRAGAILIELDDLLGFLEAHKTVSGIQRVQLGIIQHVLSLSSQENQFYFVLNETGAHFLWHVRNSDLSAIASYLSRDTVEHAELKILVHNTRKNATAVVAGRGNTYLVLGAFWGYGAVAARYAEMKRNGVAIGAYIYDLIPITHTEYCDEGLPHEFKMSFGDGLMIFDFLVAISEFSASEVRRYIDKYHLRQRPVIAVPLAHSNSSPIAPGPAAALADGTPQPSPALASLRGRPFAMMVSTIEARKNHAYLVAAWKAFIDEGLDPPDLVFVGRPGWRVTSLLEMLATTRYLDGKVHILHDLSDTDLTALYDACLFTLFPSFVEGWGLPVGESLARGKPCVASSTSALPEVGGDLVDYVDPLNLRDGLEVIRKMAFDKSYRDQRAQQIRAKFKARTWADVSAHLLSEVEMVREGLTIDTEPAVLFPAGMLFRPGDLALGKRVADDYARHPVRSMLSNGWYGIETMGCWMQSHRGEVLFRSDLTPGTPIVVYVGLYSPQFASPELKLHMWIDEGTREGTEGPASPVQGRRTRTAIPFMVGQHFPVRLEGAIGKHGLTRLRLVLTGPVTHEAMDPKSRQFALGLAYVSYTAKDDPVACLDVVERILFGAPQARAVREDELEADDAESLAAM